MSLGAFTLGNGCMMAQGNEWQMELQGHNSVQDLEERELLLFYFSFLFLPILLFPYLWNQTRTWPLFLMLCFSLHKLVFHNFALLPSSLFLNLSKNIKGWTNNRIMRRLKKMIHTWRRSFSSPAFLHPKPRSWPVVFFSLSENLSHLQKSSPAICFSLFFFSS